MTEIVKGFKDFSGKDAEKRAEIRKILVKTFEKYGFEPAETPVIEYEKFLKEGNEEDEAISDVFRLRDKGKRNLALRYEFTFQLKRLIKNKKLPYKRYQIGPVFRDEPVTANRFRQFIQCDVDIVGSSVKDEAEILAITSEILRGCGIKPKIYINNRRLLNEIFDELKIKNKGQAIREIDKFDKILEKEVRVNLKKIGAEKVLDIIKKPESYFKKYKFYKEIEQLKKFCRDYGVNVVFSPSLARGLAYYNSSVFEVKAKGIKETIVAGGSYLCGKIQATGISFGLERLSSLAKLDINKQKYLIVSLNQDRKAIELSKKIRAKDKIASIYYGKPSKALEYANSYDFSKVIFVGKKEVKAKKFKVKNMKTGKESFLKIEGL